VKEGFVMDPKQERSSSARKWWLLIGAFVIFLVAFDLVERLVRTESTPSEEGSPAAEGAFGARPNTAPELRLLKDGGIEIRHDFFRRTTIRVQSEERRKALFDCLTQGIEETFGGGTEGWDRQRVRRDTERIQDECMGSLHDPPVPPLVPPRED